MRRQAGKEFAEHTKDLSLLFAVRLLRDVGYPNIGAVANYIKKKASTFLEDIPS